ncbi:MAG: hypothetical protein COA58_10465 [Bacteroidetes bacterium]|nr:MAG: hypothetical protein COA58_10465 [Bacteroidota bacterium]
MKLKPVFLSALMALTYFSAAQDLKLDFAINVGSDITSVTNWDRDAGTAIEVDDSGNFYVAGHFTDTTDFDPSSATVQLIANGLSDMFLAKYAVDGTFQWVRRIDGSQRNVINQLEVDQNGDVIICGEMRGSTNFYPTSSGYTLSTGSLANAFVVKFASNGTIKWAKQFTSSSFVTAYTVCIDHGNNVIVSGTFATTTDFDPGTGTSILTTTGGLDAFIVKLNSNGSYIWAKQFAGSDEVRAYGVGIDSSNRVFSTGLFILTTDFDPSSASYTLSTPFSGSKDIFVCVLDSNGNFEWAKSFEHTIADWGEGQRIAIDANGNSYISGHFMGTVDFDPSTATYSLSSSSNDYRPFIVKLSPSGNFEWATSLVTQYNGFLYDMAIDANAIYITGGSVGTIITPTDTIFSNGSWDVFIAKFALSGTLQMAHKLGGNTADLGRGIDIKNSVIYITGGFSNTADFDAGQDTFDLTARGTDDIYIAKYYQCYFDTSITVVSCDSFTSLSGNQTWYLSGQYIDTIVSGCGGVIYHVDLIIPIDTSDQITQGFCDSFISPSGRHTWYTTGTYYDTLMGGSYCGRDSIITFNLVGFETISVDISVSECDSFKSPSGKYVWHNNGIYFDTLRRVNSICDSIIRFDLSINKTFSTLPISICEQYTSPSGTYVWGQTGVYLDTITNTVGCDSIITISLTILKNTSSTINVYECNSYTSPSGKYTWHTNFIGYDTISNSIGCDSFIQIIVTLSKSYKAISLSGCTPFISYSGKHIYTTTGNYKDTLVNHLGCDSILVINFTAINTSNSSFAYTACNEYTSPSGNYVWTQSGTYYDTLINANNCDSILIIDLTIEHLNDSIINNGKSLEVFQENVQYQWLDCNDENNTIVGANMRVFQPKNDGLFSAEISSTSCIDTTNCFPFILAGISNTKTMNMVLFPNPTRGKINIQTSQKVKEVIVFDSFGRIIKICHQTEIDLTNLSKGVYIIQIKTDSTSYSRRITKYP